MIRSNRDVGSDLGSSLPWRDTKTLSLFKFSPVSPEVNSGARMVKAMSSAVMLFSVLSFSS